MSDKNETGWVRVTIEWQDQEGDQKSHTIRHRCESVGRYSTHGMLPWAVSDTLEAMVGADGTMILAMGIALRLTFSCAA